MGGIAEVVLSTFDLDRAGAAMIEVGGYRRVDLPDMNRAQAAAWGAPAACTRIEQALLLPPIGTRGALRLIRFHGVEQDLIRPSQRFWDTGGIFDLDLFTKDARGVYRRLQRLGWTGFSEPVAYEMGEFDVTEVLATGPDGLVLALIEPHKPPSFDLPFEAMSRIFNSTQIVRDVEAAHAFYRDILGWSALVDLTISDPVEPADLLGLPLPFGHQARRRVVIVHPEGVNDGSVELIEVTGWQGHDYADRAVAPNVGLLMIRLPVASVEAYAAQIVARGGTLYSPPSRAEIAPYGEMARFAIRTPDGAILEFYEQPGDGDGSHRPLDPSAE